MDPRWNAACLNMTTALLLLSALLLGHANGTNCPDAQALLDAANAYRANHTARALTWSSALAQQATSYAAVLAAQQCALVHSSTGGESLYTLASYPKPDATCKRAIDAWYTEVKLYDFAAASPCAVNCNRPVGHFVQLVWRASTAVGCGVGQADVPMPRMPGGVGGCKVIVCYFKPGFQMNDAAYKANVGVPALG
ncbi:hypothetical protein GPECTOR_82g264 [Gonium pectorale]|uniref:SCP domain-containing protein n=1 Tax=Gonium pectorale TaxID=33097 RepID=A0A150G337_GONPE|nr:hypothetical protein GPECTOR_82g264 [Gonium pectorale]|eukprot:KXZ43730.1 hypothetical protein GPECTOR_82g264 [Gonium pectorale]